MLMPSIFGENLLDDFFGEPFGGYDYSESGLMTTDVKDTPTGHWASQAPQQTQASEILYAIIKYLLISLKIVSQPIDKYLSIKSILIYIRANYKHLNIKNE